jgi:peptidoglycan/xylan/chitin deacetylase (PgdA/CDA1 family)
MQRALSGRVWRPSPFVVASAALHLAAGVAILARPRLWPLSLGAVIADHLVLTAAGLWPRSSLLGSNWTRLPPAAAARGQVAITIDDGPDPEVTPRVLSVLKSHGASASFFCVGSRVERHPELAREIQSQGHTVENHSYRHAHSFSLLGPGTIHAEIARAQDCIEAHIGSRPRFFRAPAGLRNPFLDPVLARLQLQLASWTRRGFDTVNRDAALLHRRLVRSLSGGDILLLHDGNAARARRSGTPLILEVLPRLLDSMAEASLRPVTLRAALD